MLSTIYFKPQCVNLSGVDYIIKRRDYVNIMTADAVVPGVARPSAAMVLSV